MKRGASPRSRVAVDAMPRFLGTMKAFFAIPAAKEWPKGESKKMKRAAARVGEAA